MLTERIRKCGFTLLELLVVIGVLAILLAILLPALWKVSVTSKTAAAKSQMGIIAMALSKYQEELYGLPPDNVPTTNGSEVLAHYLARKMTIGASSHGPYMNLNSQSLADKNGNGLMEMISPLNNSYFCVLRRDINNKVSGFLIVDPGPDHKLGGTLDPLNGFTADASDDSKDNIVNHALQ